VDARTDIFAAAAVLFELISGERAFPGSSFPEVRRRIVQEPTPRLPPPVEGVAAGIAGVIARGLAKLPEQRFASAREMAEALRAVAGGSAAAHAQQDDWATIVQPGPAAASPTGLRAPAPETRPGSLTQSGVGATSGGSGTIGGFGSALLTTLERALGRSVGPIARVLVRRAAAASPTVEALVQTLSVEIADLSARQVFLEEAQRASATTASAVWRVDAAEVERAQRALTLHLGPVSRVLASRAAGQAGSVDELWRILSTSIEDAAERARFMARRGN
jgi:serine/threonine-protein kinase